MKYSCITHFDINEIEAVKNNNLGGGVKSEYLAGRVSVHCCKW
jgi:hypothetical protein